MTTVNIRQLRDTRKLKAWLRAGKTVELRDRNQVIGRIVPARKNKPVAKFPDFAAQKDLRRQGVAGSGYRHRGARPLLTIYADTSFFVSLYVKDVHSADADQRLSSGGRPFLTPLHLAEWAHAIAQQVFRRQMSTAEANRVRRELDEDRSAGVWETVGVPEAAMDISADLGFRYGPKLGVRTLDTLHVACALELRAERFWTFDDRQTKLAKAVGLDTR
jgi:predicted nucleic acid-binding protein/antitoxin (DNA-binding transcriptional repressor) of toxin-antitoxin stability system